MPRKAREKSATGMYHVMVRGINRQRIFDDEEDFDTFVRILQHFSSEGRSQAKTEDQGNNEKEPIELRDQGKKKPSPEYCFYAYALMSNHAHLLVKVKNIELGTVIKKISSAYVQYFNKTHGRDGHLFKERFKSEVCESDEYKMTLLRYIHQNPVKAHLVKKVEEYPYNSIHEYLNDGLALYHACDVNAVLEKMPLDEFKRLVDDPLDDSVKCIDYTIDRVRKVSDGKVVKLLQDKYGFDHPTNLQRAVKGVRNQVISDLLSQGAGVRQLQRLTGIGVATISRIKKK